MSGDFSPQGECTLCSKVVLSMIGYDMDKLALTCPVDIADSCSPSLASKKF